MAKMWTRRRKREVGDGRGSRVGKNSGLIHLLLIAAAAMVIGGCAEAGSGQPDLITAVITDAVVTKDDEKFCEDLVSPAYAAVVYGGVENCLEARARLDDDEVPPDEVIVSDIEVDDEVARATVEEVGGDTDGAKGTVTLVRRDNQWQVEELGIDYLRSLFAAGSVSLDFGVDDATNAELAGCLNDRLQRLDDDTFRAVVYASMADHQSNDELVNALIRCADRVQLPGPDGEEVIDSEALVRRQFEQGITAAAIEDGLDRAEVRCLLTELRKMISDEELAEQLDDESDDALTRTIRRAMARC